ncbi:MAG: S8 family serine peptidase [bacterium]
MRKLIVPAALACGLAACADAPSAPPTAAAQLHPAAASFGRAGDPIPGRYIVQFKSGGADAVTNAKYVERTAGGVTSYVYTKVLNGAAMQLGDDAAAALRSDPRVLSVDQDQTVSINTTQNNPPSWGLDRIDQKNLPLSNSYTYGLTGAGVTAYILDTGLNFAQADFTGRASAGIDEITSGGGSVDCNGHGTHTAGTVGSATYGVAKGVKIVAVRVLDCNGSGSFAGVIAGIDWVTTHATLPAVASMSLGGSNFAPLDTAVAHSIAAGIPYVIAAGNSSANACTESPGNTPGAITIGATTIADGFASFSDRGPCVALNAPGVNITSLWLGASGTTNTISGTSMATPHVSGVVAMYLQAHPTATPAQVRAAVIAGATANVISGVPASTPNLLLNIGFLNNGNNQAPVARFTITCPTLHCNADGSASTDDVAIVSYKWDWGNGHNETHSGPTASNTWATPGTYSVTLTVTDGGGLTGSLTKQVTIPNGTTNQPPTASITSPANGSSFVQGASVSFAGSGTDPEDGALTGASLVWTSSLDGQIGTGASFNSSTLSVGSHTITLTATDSHGLTGTATRSITITAGNQPPVAAFTFNCGGAVPHQCSFDGSTSTDDHGVVSYMWDWGNGKTETHTRTTSTNTWAAAGNVTVKLTVTDAGGLTNTKTMVIAVP